MWFVVCPPPPQPKIPATPILLLLEFTQHRRKRKEVDMESTLKFQDWAVSRVLEEMQVEIVSLLEMNIATILIMKEQWNCKLKWFEDTSVFSISILQMWVLNSLTSSWYNMFVYFLTAKLTTEHERLLQVWFFTILLTIIWYSPQKC